MKKWNTEISEANHNVYWIGHSLLNKAEAFRETGNQAMATFLEQQSDLLFKANAAIEKANDSAFSEYIKHSTSNSTLNGIVAGINYANSKKGD